MLRRPQRCAPVTLLQCMAAQPVPPVSRQQAAVGAPCPVAHLLLMLQVLLVILNLLATVPLLLLLLLLQVLICFQVWVHQRPI